MALIPDERVAVVAAGVSGVQTVNITYPLDSSVVCLPTPANGSLCYLPQPTLVPSTSTRADDVKPATESKKSSNNVGVIVGSVLGSFLGLLLLIGLLLLWVWR